MGAVNTPPLPDASELVDTPPLPDASELLDAPPKGLQERYAQGDPGVKFYPDNMQTNVLSPKDPRMADYAKQQERLQSGSMADIAVGRGAQQGYSWGQGTRIEAGAKALQNGTSYQQELKNIEEPLNKAKAERPYLYGLGYLTGAVASPLNKLLTPVFGKIAELGSKLGLVGNTLVGATGGAAVASGLGAGMGYVGEGSQAPSIDRAKEGATNPLNLALGAGGGALANFLHGLPKAAELTQNNAIERASKQLPDEIQSVFSKDNIERAARINPAEADKVVINGIQKVQNFVSDVKAAHADEMAQLQSTAQNLGEDAVALQQDMLNRVGASADALETLTKAANQELQSKAGALRGEAKAKLLNVTKGIASTMADDVERSGSVITNWFKMREAPILEANKNVNVSVGNILEDLMNTRAFTINEANRVVPNYGLIQNIENINLRQSATIALNKTASRINTALGAAEKTGGRVLDVKLPWVDALKVRRGLSKLGEYLQGADVTDQEQAFANLSKNFSQVLYAADKASPEYNLSVLDPAYNDAIRSIKTFRKVFSSRATSEDAMVKVMEKYAAGQATHRESTVINRLGQTMDGMFAKDLLGATDDITKAMRVDALEVPKAVGIRRQIIQDLRNGKTPNLDRFKTLAQNETAKLEGDIKTLMQTPSLKGKVAPVIQRAAAGDVQAREDLLNLVGSKDVGKLQQFFKAADKNLTYSKIPSSSRIASAMKNAGTSTPEDRQIINLINQEFPEVADALDAALFTTKVQKATGKAELFQAGMPPMSTKGATLKAVDSLLTAYKNPGTLALYLQRHKMSYGAAAAKANLVNKIYLNGIRLLSQNNPDSQ